MMRFHDHCRLLFVATAVLGAGCEGRVSLAPHLNRENDLGPPASAGRYNLVLDRALAFENQNQKSRDIHWYRAWRAAAMIGLGQVDQGLALVDQILADVASSPAPPAQPDRLRMFAADLKARGALSQARLPDALAELERAYQLATEVQLETRGACDHPLMLAARLQQIAEVAEKAGDVARVVSARAGMSRQLDKWTHCLTERDYPGWAPVESVAAALSSEERRMAQAAAPPSAVPAPATPARRSAAAVASPSRTGREDKGAPGKASRMSALATVRAQYAPVDSAPWRSAIETTLKLVGRHAAGAKGDIVIRTDGGHHALRLRISMPRFEGPEQLTEVFRASAPFFEQARTINPRVDRVLVVVEGPGGPTQILAHKDDVLELFVDRIDVRGFVRKLVQVM